MKRPAQLRRDTGSHVQGWIFRAQRISAANRNGAGQKLAYDGIERNIAVGNVNRRLGVNHSAALRPGKPKANERDGDERSQSRQKNQQDMIASRRIFQSEPGDRVDGNVKTDDEEAREDADQDREQQKTLGLIDRVERDVRK